MVKGHVGIGGAAENSTCSRVSMLKLMGIPYKLSLHDTVFPPVFRYTSMA
jgi:hypothetical protein